MDAGNKGGTAVIEIVPVTRMRFRVVFLHRTEGVQHQKYI
jgi:hypothetical protein